MPEAWKSFPNLSNNYTPFEPYSYMIFNNRGLVKVKDGLTGEIVFRNIDASTATQWAVDHLSSTGGKIYIKRGNYIFYITVIIGNLGASVLIEGSGKGTHIIAGNPISPFEIDTATGLSGFQLRNMWITGAGKTSANGAGILIDNTGNGNYVEEVIIDHIWVNDCKWSGIDCHYIKKLIIHDFYIWDCHEQGIDVSHYEENLSISKGYVWNCDDAGISFSSNGDKSIVTKVFAINNDKGIAVSKGSTTIGQIIILENNYTEGNDSAGVRAWGAADHIIPHLEIIGHKSYQDDCGLSIKYCTKLSITGGQYIEPQASTGRGWLIQWVTDLQVTGGFVSGSGDDVCAVEFYHCDGLVNGLEVRDSSRSGIYILTCDGLKLVGCSSCNNVNHGYRLNDNADNNTLMTCIGNNNGSHGIYIQSSNCNDNAVHGCELKGNTTIIEDFGTDTKYDTIVVPFVTGNKEEVEGWEIDTAGDYALAFMYLPDKVQKTMRFRIYAFGASLCANQMQIEIWVKGASDNEPYGTHSAYATNLKSLTDGFAANDIIRWNWTHAQVLALKGGDSIQIKVGHEVATGDDCSTDAHFRTVHIDYV